MVSGLFSLNQLDQPGLKCFRNEEDLQCAISGKDNKARLVSRRMAFSTKNHRCPPTLRHSDMLKLPRCDLLNKQPRKISEWGQQSV